MRVSNAEHTSRPSRIHGLTRDFRLEDVWELPGVGGLTTSLDWCSCSPRSTRRRVRPPPSARCSPSGGGSGGCSAGTSRTPASAPGCRVPTLRDRLPADLRAAPSGPCFDALAFTPLYLTDDEWAAEIANRTVHGVMHLGRIPDPTGGVRAQMVVYARPNGLFGAAYMAAIKPFRYLIVYPPLLREMGRLWRADTRPTSWQGGPT